MIETLNADCFCVSLDRDALRETLEADPAAEGLARLIEEKDQAHPLSGVVARPALADEDVPRLQVVR